MNTFDFTDKALIKEARRLNLVKKVGERQLTENESTLLKAFTKYEYQLKKEKLAALPAAPAA